MELNISKSMPFLCNCQSLGSGFWKTICEVLNLGPVTHWKNHNTQRDKASDVAGMDISGERDIGAD